MLTVPRSSTWAFLRKKPSFHILMSIKVMAGTTFPYMRDHVFTGLRVELKMEKPAGLILWWAERFKLFQAAIFRPWYCICQKSLQSLLCLSHIREPLRLLTVKAKAWNLIRSLMVVRTQNMRDQSTKRWSYLYFLSFSPFCPWRRYRRLCIFILS